MNLGLPYWVKNKGKGGFLNSGEYGLKENEVARLVDSQTGFVFYYAFDPRTRVGPFVGPDINMPNCGIRSVAGAVYNVGFKNTRVVFGPWNPNFDFRAARLNGEIPEVFGIGSMQINEADAHKKIEQATDLGTSRPLIIGGGPHANYQAEEYFSRNPSKSVDVAVRGESYVLLSLLEAILLNKGKTETMLQGFERARREGALQSIPGLMYISDDREVLVDTGKQRQVADLDELPREIIGLGLLEQRHDGKGLYPIPVSLDKLRKNGTKIVSTITSHGCNFRCEYCPIPKMHQFTERAKSPERMVSDIKEILENVGKVSIFGTDDNSFAFPRRYIESLYGAMASATANGRSFRDALFYGTEATEHQVDLNSDLMPLLRDAGVRALWFGIEDLTADLVKKGQTPDKTTRLFHIMTKHGIAPMPMMMHYDGQPLRSEAGSLEGILDQVEFLEKHGAQSMQVTYNTPSIGSDDFPKHFERGTVFSKIGDMFREWYLFDGNHVVSTKEPDPLGRQNNLLVCYERFYNPRKLLRSALDYIKANLTRDRVAKDIAEVALTLQIYGRKGLEISKTNLREWRNNLATRVYEFANSVPRSDIPLVSVG